MGFLEDYDVAHRKEELIETITSVAGHEPPGLRVLLRTLTHPDVVAELRRYLDLIDTTTRCLNYEPPWSCAREAEAKYENVRFGWFGGAGGIGFDDNWCAPCREKVLGPPIPAPTDDEVESFLHDLDVAEGRSDVT